MRLCDTLGTPKSLNLLACYNLLPGSAARRYAVAECFEPILRNLRNLFRFTYETR